MSTNLTPEERARVLIEELLTQAGWAIQDRKEIDLVNHVGVAVRETVLKNVAAGMNLYYPVDDVFNESRKEEYFDWLCSNLVKFKNLFTPYIREFKCSAAAE